MSGILTTKKNAELFQKMLKPYLADPVIESWQLAVALDWAKEENIEFVWFKEDAAGLTHNGLSLVDQNGKLIWDDITGFEDLEEKLLQEAMSAHLVMHADKTRIEWDDVYGDN